jgi:hypothetical protein
VEFDLETLRRKVLAERGGATGSWPWTDRLLTTADRQFGGTWSGLTLTGATLANILLPPHAGEPCRGDLRDLVPPGGLTVADTAQALSKVQREYERDNPECWQRIARAAVSPFSTVVLATAPLDATDYLTLEARAGTLYHLDGFHRLVGWAWSGRLTSDVSIQAVIAGSVAGSRR